LPADIDAADRQLVSDKRGHIAVFGAEGDEQRLLDGERHRQRDHQHRELRGAQRPYQKALHQHAEAGHQQHRDRSCEK
jgi:hypothetical protein